VTLRGDRMYEIWTARSIAIPRIGISRLNARSFDGRQLQLGSRIDHFPGNS